MRRKVAGKREMVTFINVHRELGDGVDSLDLALPPSSGELILGMDGRSYSSTRD